MLQIRIPLDLKLFAGSESVMTFQIEYAAVIK